MEMNKHRIPADEKELSRWNQVWKDIEDCIKKNLVGAEK